MARTKASVGAKISSGKSSKARCSVAPTSNSGSSSAGTSKSVSSGGGNPVCPRETPAWQRPITSFFTGPAAGRRPDDDSSGDELSPEKSKKKRARIIDSDEDTEGLAKNRELDESITLLPLDGDSSHKIDEFYPKNGKGKGIGKKTTNKENEDVNVKINTNKRDLEDIDLVEETAHNRKRVKVN